MTSVSLITQARSSRGVSYYLRLVATWFCFIVFGTSGLLLGVTIVPLVWILSRSRERRTARMRWLVHQAFRGFINLMGWCRGITCSVAGNERLGRPGQLIVANHPTLVDVVLLLASTPGAGCVVKRAIWRNPLTAAVVRGAGYLPNSPTDEMILKAAELLSRGESLIIFPEGTRSVAGQPLTFHRAAANIALRSAKVVTPVFLHVNPPALSKALPWYQVPVTCPHLSLRVGDDIDPAQFRGRSLPVCLAGAQSATDANLCGQACGDLELAGPGVGRPGFANTCETRNPYFRKSARRWSGCSNLTGQASPWTPGSTKTWR